MELGILHLRRPDPAEQAVARLVATGHSNREAAAELYVSVKTVEAHLGHIFAKLGIRSRHDLITATAPRKIPSEPQSGSHLGSGPDDTAPAAGDDNNQAAVLMHVGFAVEERKGH